MNQREFHQLVLDTEPECTEINPGYYFADPNDEEEPYGRSEQALAVSICQRCPIRYECFMFAVEHEIDEGVWGASVPQQREAYRNRLALRKVVGED